MKLSCIQLSLLSLLIIFFFFSILVHVHGDEELYDECAPFSCGDLINISYPFWGNGQPDYCGLPGFRIDCNQNVAILDIMSLKYYVLDINPDGQILRIARIDLSDNVCPAQLLDTTLNLTIFSYTSSDENATLLYDCQLKESTLPYVFNCPPDNIYDEGYLMLPSKNESAYTLGCNFSVLVPVLERAVEEFRRAELTVTQVLNQGFEIRWITVTDEIKCRGCVRSGGRCGYNYSNAYQFSCFCPDQVYDRTCPSPPPPAGQFDPAVQPHDESRSDDDYYTKCERMFNCGNLENLRYPFWSDDRPTVCGQEGFKLKCEDGQFPNITISDQEFRVISVDQDHYGMKIARADYWKNACPQNFVDTINPSRENFNYSVPVQNVTLFYNCSEDILERIEPNILFHCPSENDQQQYNFYTTNDQLKQSVVNESYCQDDVTVTVPSDDLKEILSGYEALKKVLEQGFNVSYGLNDNCRPCNRSGGICGTNATTSAFTCLCRDQSDEFLCHPENKANIRMKVGIGFAASLGSIAIMLIAFYIYLRRKKRGPYAPSSYVSQSLTSDYSSRSDFEKGGSNHLCVHLFTYAELEQATDNFNSAKELGEGGFGTVYYGQLKDGRIVAVKRLYENNYKRVEQFMNEVDILTRLRHQNLVSLYGCTSRHSRELLLVYEYISNGTVADHLHGERAKPGELPWFIRMKIAVETASALKYLHATDIIHRDVKTNNILLDNNFTVKVADFGLSRLFPMHVTHVSTAPQGTPGYVDPEYHECYQLTDKSDVYSFGVVLMELISSMPAVDITRHRHEINLSNMAINKIQSGALHELVDHNVGYESDYAVRKMINAVAELAFQCLQSAKELRPSMEEVLLTLKEIQTKDYDLDKAEEMGGRSDHVGLLKSGPLPPSPETVMIKWNSTSTTPTDASC